MGSPYHRRELWLSGTLVWGRIEPFWAWMSLQIVGKNCSKLGLFELLRQLRSENGNASLRIVAGFTRPLPKETAKVPAGLLVDMPYLFRPGARLLSGLGCPPRRMDQKIGYLSSPGMPVHLLGEALRGEGLEESQTQQLQAFLAKWQHVFSSHDEDYGRTDIVKHQIPTGDAAPSRERYRPVPPTLYSEVRTLLRGMLEKGIIRESSSPWAAPIVLVRKKTGAWRFCVDYRRLNQVTKKDAFPLPRIEDSLTSLTQAAWYSTLDLASGYWQVQVEEGDREKTAFTTPFGLFEWDRMPFGLCNAPATFQRLMQRCLGGQLVDTTLVYLDDVIVYSPDFESHLQHLEQVFRAMEKYGLKLQPDKCQLFRKEVKFLGHCVSASGVSVDPEKVSVVQGWSAPKTVRQVRSFLGFVGYYRRFIKDFSKIARPLNQLLVGSGRPRGRGSPPSLGTPHVTWPFRGSSRSCYRPQSWHTQTLPSPSFCTPMLVTSAWEQYWPSGSREWSELSPTQVEVFTPQNEMIPITTYLNLNCWPWSGPWVRNSRITCGEPRYS